MTLLALIRHLPTVWNEEGKLQGRTDVPPLHCEPATPWHAPVEFSQYLWLSSPLERCRATARRLGVDAAVEPRLIEMDWGQWEGRTLADLRGRLGAAMTAEEARGLDFRPPGGESPRDVQARIAPLLAEIATLGRDTAAITHKGVIRAVLALATGWDMLGKPPYRLSWSAVHLFRLDSRGHPSIERLNLPLECEPR
ncbi:MAG TPA: histidine phosphatase family protein [Stellaceae bacterium]|nr:histidine phosphatase family protein [Stellaceae bacterium]